MTSHVRGYALAVLTAALLCCTGARRVGDVTTIADKLVVNDTIGLGSGARLEVFGLDGGIAVAATGDAATRETFYTAFQKDSAGLYQKSMSISTVWANTDHQNGFAVTRYNSAYMDTGVQRDDIALQTYGDHGAVFFAPDSSAASAPGRHVLAVHGTITVNGDDLAAHIVALEAQIRRLEAQIAAR